LVALFQNATNLRQKYGVEPTATSVSRPADHQDHDPDDLESNTQPTGIDFQSLAVEPNAIHGLISKRRFQWAVRDAERFKELVNEVREIIDSLCSVLDLGRRAHLNRQLLEKALSVDVPDGLATIRDGLADTVYHDISATAEVRRTTISSLAQADWVAHHGDQPDTAPAPAPALPMTLDFELDIDRLKEVPMDNRRCVRKYQGDENATPVSVVLEWKEFDRKIKPRDEAVLNINLYRLAACLEASSGDFHTLKLLGYVRDPDPRFGNPRIGLLYRCPADQDTSSQFETLLDRLKRTRMSSSEIPDLGSRFKLAHTLATAVYHLLASGWLHKGLRSHNILLFQRTSLARPYLVGFDHSRPDHPKEDSVRNEAVLEFNRYRHPSYLRNKEQRYQKRYDVYALGVILLEIALWSTAEDLHERMRGRTEGLGRFPEYLKENCVNRIAPSAGVIYRDVVRACLEAADSVAEDELQSWFGEQIVAALATCNA
jgi:Prion-inhibition and propagation